MEGERNNENIGNNEDVLRNAAIAEEELALRRNQALMIGIVLLGILAITLAVSVPSDFDTIFDFDDNSIPSKTPVPEQEQDSIPSILNIHTLTNSSKMKAFFNNPENSVDSILRNIAIHKAIEGFRNDRGKKNGDSKENDRVNQIVQSFIETEDFEDFIIDIEIIDVIKRLRKEKGYKRREATIFDDLFKQIEKHFLGDDPEEVRLVRKVGEELERRARSIISERKLNSGNEIEEDIIANEIFQDLETSFAEQSGDGDNGD